MSIIVQRYMMLQSIWIVAITIAAVLMYLPSQGLEMKNNDYCRNKLNEICNKVDQRDCDAHKMNLDNKISFLASFEKKSECYLQCLSNDQVLSQMVNFGCFVDYPVNDKEKETTETVVVIDKNSLGDTPNVLSKIEFISTFDAPCNKVVDDLCNCKQIKTNSDDVINSDENECIRSCAEKNKSALAKKGCFLATPDNSRHWSYVESCRKLFQSHCFACIASLSNRLECTSMCADVNKHILEMEGCKYVKDTRLGTLQTHWKLVGDV